MQTRRPRRPDAVRLPAPPAPTTGRPVVHTRPARADTPFVGRRDELAVIEDALAATAHGRGQLVLVTGDAGVGKSRLVSEAIAAAVARGMTTLVGRAPSIGRPMRWHPLVHALTSTSGPGGRGEHTPADVDAPAWRGLVRMLEEDSDEHARSPFDVVDAVLEVVPAVTGTRGALVVLEDLHWADTATLHAVELLAGRLDGHRVLCVGTTRVEPEDASAELAVRLDETGLAVTIALGPLPDGDADALVAGVLGTRAVPVELLATVRHHAGGHPLAIERMVAVAVRSGAAVRDRFGWRLDGRVPIEVPAGLAAVARRREQQLDGRARRVVRALAVLGGCADESLIAAAANIPAAAVADGVRAAVAARLVTVAGGGEAPISLAGTLTGQVLVGDMLPSERSELAERALSGLLATEPDLPGDWLARVAELYELAGDGRAAARRFLGAGRRAAEAGELLRAERLLTRATALDGDSRHVAEAQEVLLQVLAAAGRPDDAEDAGRSLLRRLRERPAGGPLAARVHLDVARAAVVAGDRSAAERHLRAAADTGGPDPDVARRAAVLAAALDPPESASARQQLVVAAEDLARSGPAGDAVHALCVVARALAPQDPAAAHATLERARELATTAGLAFETLTVAAHLAMHEAGASCDSAPLHDVRRDLERRGPSCTLAEVELWLGAVEMLHADHDAAEAALERAMLLARRLGLALLPRAAATLAHLHALQGDERAVGELLDGAGRAADGSAGEVDLLAAAAGALVALVHDDVDAGRQALAACGPLAGTSGPWVWLPGLRALLLALDGDDSAAADLRRSGSAGARLNAAYLDLARATALVREGDAGRAAEAAEAGLEGLRPAPWLRHHAQRLVADVWVGVGDDERSRWLREAIAFFGAAGHRALELSCKRLLRAAGAPVPRRGRGRGTIPPGLRGFGVTSREWEVLDLLAGGLRNAEIADRLYVSPRTVKSHVANLRRKTGAADRRGLVALARSHLAPSVTG